jgi:hypothetical protein
MEASSVMLMEANIVHTVTNTKTGPNIRSISKYLYIELAEVDFSQQITAFISLENCSKNYSN